MGVKTLDEINLNYSRAIRQAERLEGRAGELKELANGDFQGCLTGIAANWEGENARAFIRKGEKLKGDLERVPDSLRWWRKPSGASQNGPERRILPHAA